MDEVHKELTEDQIKSFHEEGYLLIPSFLSPTESQKLKQWAQEVHDLPRTTDTPYMPYESHADFNGFLRGLRILSVLQRLAGEEMILFKEKINYKLAGSGGFAPHIDANAYTHVKNIKHLTVLVAVDDMAPENGGLDIVNGSHHMEISLGSDRCIKRSWVETHKWTPCNLNAGDILIFGTYLAHRSGVNTSTRDRRAVYATYNRTSEGDLHDKYYDDRRKLWPPTHLRKAGESYEEGRERYAFGSPMLSVDTRKQTSLEKAQVLLGLLESYGQGDYIGESISQLEHSLQAANQARNAGSDDELVLAALFHDIGQIIPVDETRDVRMSLSNTPEDVGRIGHETIGAEYLRAQGFSEKVCRLVNSHVAAKRYLTAVDKSYYEALSSASQKSLAFQGGPFQNEELEEFESDPLRDQMVSLRLWDDKAKVAGVKDIIPPSSYYLDMIATHLSK
ncbi:hypothetical protein B7463_g4508, partial [Scytalidium lignicola]